MNYFKVSHLTKLSNQEFPVAHEMLSEILDEDEITVEYVAKALASVKLHNPKLVILRNMNRKHHLSKNINNLKVLRNNYFSSLTGKVTSALKTPNETEQKAAEVIDAWLEAYREPLSRARIVQQTSLIQQMMAEVETVPRINTAMREVGGMEIMKSIELITSDLKVDLMRRVKEKAAESRKAQALRRAAYADMKVFLNSIEMAITLKDADSIEYMGYVKEINEALDSYRTLVLNRNTRNKNAALENEANQNALPENGEQSGSNAAPEGEQPAKAVNSGKFSAMPLNNMDLQNGGAPTNGSTNRASAMNGSETSGAATNGADKMADDKMADEPTNAQSTTAQADTTTTKHRGATINDNDSDQES